MARQKLAEETSNRGARATTSILAKLVKWWNKAPLKRKYVLQPGGWLQINRRHVKVVDQLNLIPGLKYRARDEGDGYNVSRVVYVTNDVGDLIELYMSLDENYADMELNEFISKALPKMLE